jgi:TPR repeat protein
MTSTLPRIVLFSTLVALAPAAHAADDPDANPLVAACDARATNPQNEDNPAGIVGVAWDNFDAEAALAPCETAHTAFPAHDRTRFHLGRVFYKLGRDAEAERIWLEAVENDYLMARRALSELYRDSQELKDGTKALALLDPCAARGVPSCQTSLGDLYLNGAEDVARDPAKALGLFESAAAAGDIFAMSVAGWMYDEGVGTDEDDAQAVAWYLPAAGAGDFFAQNNLAVHYERGEGVAQDDGLSLYWYEKAAAQGDAEDQFIVGGHYLDGIGTEPDYAKAAEWFRRAADQGYAKAATNLQKMIDEGLVAADPAD